MFCSYVMGMSDEILALEKEGFRIQRDGENYMVLIPEEAASRWEAFVTDHLQTGYWNEYLAGDRVVFLFRLSDGIRRYEVFDFHHDEVHALCETLCECSLPSLGDMLWGNWFYKLQMIRASEKRSHEEIYRTETLYEGNTWLKKPVQTVMELLPRLEGRGHLQVLDLGCGVGRNAIAVAKYFDGCEIHCVDLLETAMEKLRENAILHGVEGKLRGTVSSIEDFPILQDTYDLILAVSALEHVKDENAFAEKLGEISAGLKNGGYLCLIINTQVEERDAITGELLPAQFEVNLSTDALNTLLEKQLASFAVCKHTVVPQCYEIPRDTGTSRLKTNVVTYVASKERG